MNAEQKAESLEIFDKMAELCDGKNSVMCFSVIMGLAEGLIAEMYRVDPDIAEKALKRAPKYLQDGWERMVKNAG